MSEQSLTFELSIKETNVILNALAQRPWSEVNQVIDIIKHQVEGQCNGSSTTRTDATTIPA